MKPRAPILAAVGATSLAVAVAACVPRGPDLEGPGAPTIAALPALVVTSSITLSGTTEPGTKVRVFHVGGGDVDTVAAAGTSWELANVVLTLGVNSFGAVALDEYDNESVGFATAGVTYEIDTFPPNAVELLRPVDRTSVPDGLPAIAWKPAVDEPAPGSGIASYTVTVDATVFAGVTATSLTLGTALAPGWHTVKVRATDTLDNEGPDSLPRRFYVGVFGDVNGDGRPDVVAGAPGHDENPITGDDAGRGYGWHGAEPPDATADVTRTGASTTRLGATVAVVADLDGDARAEMAFASPSTGLVDVLLGNGDPAIPITGGGRAGASIASGDANGDGLAELFLGAPDCDVAGGSVAAGCVRVYVGTTAGFAASVAVADLVIEGDPAEANGDFGAAVAFAGDTDGDGTPELAVGAPNADGGRGLVYLFPLSQLSGVMDVGDATVLAPAGLQPGDRFGAALAGGRDADGDGLPDVVAGAPDDGTGGNGTGHVYVLHPGEICDIAPATVSSRTGTSVALLGPFDASRAVSAIAAGSPAEGAGIGGVRVFVSALSADRCDYDVSFGAGASGSALGTSVAAAGDLGPDGSADLIAGAPGVNEVWIYLGDATLPASLPTPVTIAPPFTSATVPGDAVRAGASVGGIAP